MSNKLMKPFGTNSWLNMFDIFPTTFSETFDEMFKNMEFFDIENQRWSLSKGFPRGDMYLEGDTAKIELALAGYNKDQLSVQAEDNCLTVSAKKSEDANNGPRTIARRSFTQTFRFGKEYDLDKTEVKFENGLLQITVPKIDTRPKVVKAIEIK